MDYPSSYPLPTSRFKGEEFPELPRLDQDSQIVARDFVLLVRHAQEGVVDRFEALFGEVESHLRKAMLQTMSSRARGQNNLRLLCSDQMRVDDLVGGALLEHAVLVDAAGVRVGVGPDDRLVALDHHAGELGNHARGLDQKGGVDAGLDVEKVLADHEGGDDLFERGVAGPLADAVEGDLDLARSTDDPGQGVGGGHP